MLHQYELDIKPMRCHVRRLIEDKIWERHLLGFTWLNLEFVELDDGIIEELKATYKEVAVHGDGKVKELHIVWR